MNVRKYLEFVRAAEDGNGTPEPDVIPENALAVDPAGDPPQPGAEDPEPNPEPAPHGNKGKTPWYMERINEETNKRVAAEQRANVKERESADAKALIERLQKGGDPPETPRGDAPDFDSAVDAAAAKKLLYRESQAVLMEGQKDFADFGDSLKILTAAGATTDEFVEDLIDADRPNAAKLIDYLAKNPERAVSLAAMTSRRRVAELTRISMSELKAPDTKVVVPPKPVAVSKVPPPKPVVEPSSGVEDDVDEDKMSDAQWSAWRKKQLQKRA